MKNAQTSVESRNFQYRKSTLEYDDVMNKQREIIYGQRKQVLDGMDIKQTVLNMLRSSIESQVAFAFGEHDKTDDEHRADALKSCEGTYFPRGAVDANSLSGLSADDLTDRFYEAAEKYYEAKEAAVTSPIMRELERVVLLRVVDEYWMDHIDAMSELRQAIRLQSYGNNKPIDVYKQESLTMFEDMISAIQGDTVRRIFSARIKTEGEVKRERVADGIVASTSGDGTVKKLLCGVLEEVLVPIRARRAEYEKDLGAVADMLKAGSEAAREAAATTLDDVRHAMRIDYFNEGNTSLKK